MFNRTHLASAVLFALSCNAAIAQTAPSDTSNDAGNQSDDIEVIEVSGVRASLSKAINIKRNNVQIVDAIVAEDIGKFPDNNVVEALQRVTGVQVTDRGAGEVNTVTIRGLNDVTTTVNGRNVFTASGRMVALADIPAALLRNVSVYKTRSASQIGSGIAGQIDVETQRPFNFDDKTFVFAGRAVHQEQADKTDPQISMLASDRWDLGDNGEFGALLNVAYTRTNFRDQSITAGAMVPFTSSSPSGAMLGGAEYGPLQRIFPAECSPECWSPGLDAGLSFAPGSTLNLNGTDAEYYLSRDAIFASDFTGKRERPAVNLSLQWAPDSDSTYTFEAFYNGYEQESFNSLFFQFVDWWGNVDPNDPVTLIDGTNIVQSRYVNDAFNFTSGDVSKAKTDTYLFALGGDWQVTDFLSLKSEIYYQTSEYTTEFFALRGTTVQPRVFMNVNDGSGIPSLEYPETDPADASLYSVGEAYDNASASEGDAITWTVDGEYFLENDIFTKVSFGSFIDRRTAKEGAYDYVGSAVGGLLTDYDENLQYTNSNFFDGNANFPSSWVAANGYYAFNNREQYRELAGLPANPEIFYNFDIEETTISLYGQVDFNTEVAGRVLDGQFGLRYEMNDADMTFFTEDTSLPPQSFAERSDNTLLPSLVLRYELAEDLMLRAAYTETIRRPEMSQLNSYVRYFPDVTDIGYGTATGGNPNLKPVESTNIDFSLEWYFAPESSLYATYFTRDIEGFVYDSVVAQDYQGPTDDEPYTYIVSLPDNTSNGKLDGWEFGAIYFPDYLPGLLDGLGVQASYTLLDSSQDIPIFDRETGELNGYSNQPIFGVSDSSYSGVLVYDNNELSMRLSYVWRDDFLNNYEARLFANPLGVYRKPERSMDFQLTYNVTENLTLTFDATNLTEEIYQSYYQYPDTHNFGSSLYSRTFALGARFKI